ncbi:hypothetical protein CHS0354_030403 [Potamilus streckersoni]|uniref:Uncharacterized protein n=1 Tax=Potamilus streckersoni TaxID=2493646 RepID=A0AAE0S8E1_9BIVA|nr:hypothetical protein CHS0354_030403 [Potamilus streckersoni]
MMLPMIGSGVTEMPRMGGGMPMMGGGITMMGGELPIMMCVAGGMPALGGAGGMPMMCGTGVGKGKSLDESMPIMMGCGGMMGVDKPMKGIMAVYPR